MPTNPGLSQPNDDTAGADALLASLRLFVRREASRLLDDPNVTSVGIGRKAGGAGRGELAIQVTVATKLPPEQLEGAATRPIPPTVPVGGIDVPTDVLQRTYAPAASIRAPTGAPPALPGRRADSPGVPGPGDTPVDVGSGFDLLIPEAADDERRSRLDPVLPGISVGHVRVTAGTFGCVVYDAAGDPAPLMLSNWHVLRGDTGQVGDEVVQPGPRDDPAVAANHAGTLLRSHLGPEGDCAVARIEGRGVDPHVLGLGVAPASHREVSLGEAVVKSGRTTGVSYGVVQRIEVVVELAYGSAGTHRIGGIEIGPDPDRPPKAGEISRGGDSGAVWLVAAGDAATSVMAGLHFAGEVPGGGPDHAIACAPAAVFEVLGVGLAAAEAAPSPVRAGAPTGPAAPASQPRPERLEAPRTGYDEDFLGTRVPLPGLTDAAAADATLLDGDPVIPYTHFSLTLSSSRRLARSVAWNVDGGTLRRLSRDGLDFRFDPRLPQEAQLGDELYAGNRLDRGHLARRADLCWGPADQARRANADSFFFPNITPQLDDFNQASRGGVWGRLEDALFADVDVEELRICAAAGPVLDPRDPAYRGIAVPREFWKAITYVTGGQLRTRAFLFAQDLDGLEALDLGEFATYQVGLEQVTARSGVTFPEVMRAAQETGRPEAVARRLEGTDDIRW